MKKSFFLLLIFTSIVYFLKAQQPILVKDICLGSCDGFPELSLEKYYPPPLQILNNKILFRAFDNINGLENWQSDGTEIGTTKFENYHKEVDLCPVVISKTGNYYIANSSNDTTDLLAINSKNGKYELIKKSSYARVVKNDDGTFLITSELLKNDEISHDFYQIDTLSLKLTKIIANLPPNEDAYFDTYASKHKVFIKVRNIFNPKLFSILVYDSKNKSITKTIDSLQLVKSFYKDFVICNDELYFLGTNASFFPVKLLKINDLNQVEVVKSFNKNEINDLSAECGIHSDGKNIFFITPDSTWIGYNLWYLDSDKNEVKKIRDKQQKPYNFYETSIKIVSGYAYFSHVDNVGGLFRTNGKDEVKKVLEGINFEYLYQINGFLFLKYQKVKNEEEILQVNLKDFTSKTIFKTNLEIKYLSPWDKYLFFINVDKSLGSELFKIPYESLIKSKENVLKINSLALFPNPNDTYVNVVNPLDENVKLEFFNINGIKVKEEILINRLNKIDVNDLLSGIYILKAKYNETIYTTKFIKI